MTLEKSEIEYVIFVLIYVKEKVRQYMNDENK